MDIATLRERHPDHWMRSTAIRVLALDAVAAANSGHSGMPMGMADIATVLWSKHLKFDAKAPGWPDRDRFIISNGHGSMLLYALLHLTGYEDMTLDELKNFRQWGAKTAGHPEHEYASGIDTTTGPLGQGLATSVGMAIAEESLRARFGKKVIDHHTYVFAGDGCLMEGVSHEAIALAGHQKLSHLILFFDNNGISIDGEISKTDSTDQPKRFEACGWHVQSIDGHDPEAIDAAIEAAKKSGKPSMIDCKTHIALGSSAQDTGKGHGALTDEKLIKDTREAYGWSHGPFDIPADIKSWWEEVGRRGADERAAWNERLDDLAGGKRKQFDAAMERTLPNKLTSTIRNLKKQISEDQPKDATRKSSENVLKAVNPVVKEMLGGSADLTGSNNTLTPDLGVFSPEDRAGRYIHYGIREHGMAAAMNGMALHGGIRPYGGTFMCFSDYARPAMRLSALMGAPVTYVMTHDSIGLGEDGPTHQPVEHLAMLRATPNMQVIRPCDGVETAEAWEVALRNTDVPTVLVLTRQGLPTLRTKHQSKNLVEQGAYILAEADAKRQAVLIASGSEVSVAMEAKALLEEKGIGARVVSIPSFELFAKADESYRRRVLPAGAVRVGIEAAARLGWDRWLTGERGRDAKAAFVGMDSFGASAPAEVLFEKFGITADNVVAQVENLL
ncbi:transketolase [Palleronia marisminoris]|uniref:Transketolase n=1 Tax=Palleronia marisminoris TaxID=315423 RepID=A0A1Y5RH32_9RHOB|nr:transketolase [Palleronia marisminoris]SFG19970.1 transketolase [Palleronia marisminoris]SLN17290.1 Transketolase 1 [Palleronia marisminoris]